MRDANRHLELCGYGAYAVCLKEDGKAIGAVELKLNGHTDMTDRDDEREMGYWIGKPFWGQGIMPEAVKEMLRHAFEECGMQKVWIGYYEGNNKSKRVQEKCGFKYQWRSEYEIDRVLCIPPNEGKGAPCGACRELMVQLMPGEYKDIDIMIDYSKGKVMKLGELTPEWWID